MVLFLLSPFSGAVLSYGLRTSSYYHLINTSAQYIAKVHLAVQQAHLLELCAVLRLQLHELAWMYTTLLLNVYKHSMNGLLLHQKATAYCIPAKCTGYIHDTPHCWA